MQSPDSLTELVSMFRRRALRLRIQGYGVLSINAAVFAFGVYVFLAAGNITASDVRTIDRPEELYKQRAEALTETVLAEKALSRLEKETPSSPEQRAMLEKQRDRLGRELAHYRASEEISSARIKDLESRAAAQTSRFDTSFLLATNINRFGTMLIVVFLTSVLVTLFRYNVRLAAYYDARADTLLFMVGKIDQEVFGKIVLVLSPESYDFGKMPKSPAQHAVELAKEVVSRTKS